MAYATDDTASGITDPEPLRDTLNFFGYPSANKALAIARSRCLVSIDILAGFNDIDSGCFMGQEGKLVFFLKRLHISVWLGAVLLCLSTTAALADSIKLAHFISPKHHLHVNFFEPLAQSLQAETNGELTLQIYPAGQLGAGPARQYSRVVDGIADIVHGLPGYTASLFPKTLMAEYPTVTHSAESATAGLWNAMDFLDSEYQRVKLLAIWTSAPTIFMTRDKPVRSPSDLSDLKLRVPSSNAGKVLEAWGGTPVSMPIPAVYNALQTGVIDGIMTDASVIKNFKLHEVANYYTVGFPSTVSVFFLLMNRDSWEALDSDEQAALMKLTGPDFSIRAAKAYRDAAAQGLDLIRGLAGKEIIQVTPEQAAAFGRLAEPVLQTAIDEMNDRGVDARAMVTAMGEPE